MRVVKENFHKLRRIFAKKWLNIHKNLTLIAITGSYGKTAVSTAVTSVLATKFKTLQTDTNLDTIYNVPITALKIRGHRYAVFELGVDHPGEMDLHLDIVKPDLAVLTGISPVHADKEHLGSLEGIIKEKSKLLKSLAKDQIAVVNYDDINARRIASGLEASVWFYGTSPANCQVWFEKPEVTLEGTSLILHYRWESVKVKLKLIGSFHGYTASAAAAVGVSQGLNLLEIAKGLQSLRPLPGRMSIENGPLGSILLNDSRRANPASTIAGLEVMDEIKHERKIVVLGQMGELGEYEEVGHRDVGKKVGSIKPDFLLCVGPLTKYIQEEAVKKMPRERVEFAQDVFEAAEILKKVLKKDDLVYLKGSLLKHLERIPLIIEGKKVDSDEVASHRYEVYR